MSITLNIKKGLDLEIAGAPEGNPARAQEVAPARVALIPDDYHGLQLKPAVKPGDKVKAGSRLMQDKTDGDIAVTSPVSGTVEAVERGDRRKLLKIVITSDGGAAAEKFDIESAKTADGIRLMLKQSGLWAMIRQRPYDIVAKGDSTPRDIYVTALDPAPLAGDVYATLAARKADLEAGVKTLGALTAGRVYVARAKGSAIPDIAGAEMVDVEGPYPSGNAGVVIANTKPVNKGETVWTLDAFTLARIGALATTGRADYSTVVAVGGSEVKAPGYILTTVGCDIDSILKGRLADTTCHKRIISGNVFTGKTVSPDGYLRSPFTQVTVIPEGDDVVEFMGWASLSPKKMSGSRTFPGRFLGRIFRPDARLLGGKRAMIMSGEYDKVLPMDIMAEYLVKAILSKNIEQMEALGIYEIAPEDVAAAEYCCTSKMPLQDIVREGLDYLRKELE